MKRLYKHNPKNTENTRALALRKTTEQLIKMLAEEKQKSEAKDAQIKAQEEKIRTLENEKNTMRKELVDQGLDILEIQKKLGIQPKPLKEFT